MDSFLLFYIIKWKEVMFVLHKDMERNIKGVKKNLFLTPFLDVERDYFSIVILLYQGRKL